MTTEQQRRLLERRRRFLIRALESGNYLETQLALRDDRGFCPLGVGCDVFKRATGRGIWEIHPSFPDIDNGMRAFSVDGETVDAVLPEIVRQWFGFKYSNGAWDEQGYITPDLDFDQRSLTSVNDRQDDGGFARVVAILKNPPEGLFVDEVV